MTDHDNNTILNMGHLSSPREEASTQSDMATRQEQAKITNEYDSAGEEEDQNDDDTDTSNRAHRGGGSTTDSQQHSPTTSVSVSSVAPTLVSALLEKASAPPGTQFPFDLTPVMRNTSIETGAPTTNAAGSRNALEHYTQLPKPRVQDAALVSPPDDEATGPEMPCAEDNHTAKSIDEDGGIMLLHMSSDTTDGAQRSSPQDDKEHLSLPSDLVNNHNTAGLPPLRVSASGRSQSCTVHSLAQQQRQQPPPPIAVPVFESKKKEAQGAPPPTLRPVPFPTRTKYYSFTSRQQYEDSASLDPATNVLDLSEGHYYDHEEEEEHARYPLHHHPQRLIPYQPARPDDAMLEVPPEEELNQIFAARSTHPRPPDSEKHHRLGVPPPHVPRHNLMERQESDVPSLHLANRLSATTTTLETGDNASITTHTTLNTLEYYNDEESFLGGGGTSWSSLPQDEALVEAPDNKTGVPPQQNHHRHTSSETPSVIVEGLDDELVLGAERERERHDDTDGNAHDPNVSRRQSPPSDNDTTMAVDGRHLKEVEALEWLQSLQLEPQIAEAASSKFLCNSPVHSPTRRGTLPPRPSSPVLP